MNELKSTDNIVRTVTLQLSKMKVYVPHSRRYLTFIGRMNNEFCSGNKREEKKEKY